MRNENDANILLEIHNAISIINKGVTPDPKGRIKYKNNVTYINKCVTTFIPEILKKSPNNVINSVFGFVNHILKSMIECNFSSMELEKEYGFSLEDYYWDTAVLLPNIYNSVMLDNMNSRPNYYTRHALACIQPNKALALKMLEFDTSEDKLRYIKYIYNKKYKRGL